MAVQKTPLGLVDKEVFKKLEREFDTGRITKASQDLTQIRQEMKHLDGWVRELGKMHHMAMCLFKDDDIRIPIGKEPIYELAYNLLDEMTDWKEKIDDAYDMLQDLAELAPDPDECAENPEGED